MQKHIIKVLSSIVCSVAKVTEKQIRVTKKALDEKMDEYFWEIFDKTIVSRVTTITPGTIATLLVNQYLEIPHVDRNLNALEFWQKHQYTFQGLYKLALKYLCIPAISVPAEHIFSMAGLFTNK